MLESIRPLPAYVVSRRNRVLAANPPGRRLLPGLWDWPEEQRNPTRYLFLHPVGRTLYEPWEETVAKKSDNRTFFDIFNAPVFIPLKALRPLMLTPSVASP